MADWTSLDIEWGQDTDLTMQLVLVAFVTVRFGTAVWRSATPGSWLDVVAIWALFIVGFGFGALAAVDIQVRTHGRQLAAAALGAWVLGAIAMADQLPPLATDAMMFSAQAADVFLAGGNPYTASMQQSFELPGAAYDVSTARLDGSMVDAWSYPGGAILMFAPARLVDVQIRYVVLAAVALGAGVVIAASPPEWALGAFGSFVIAREFFTGALGGLIDPLWMTPTLISMWLWATDRWMAAAVVLGVAAGIKQHAWFILPFLAVWVWNASESPQVFLHRALHLNLAGVLGFWMMNGLFIVLSPGSWLHGVLTPVRGEPMVPLGAGLTLITRLGVYSVASWWHTLALLGVGAWLLLAYAYAFDRVKWLAWVLPAAVLFVHYRSLVTYFVTWIPLLWMAVLAHSGRIQSPWQRGELV